MGSHSLFKRHFLHLLTNCVVHHWLLGQHGFDVKVQRGKHFLRGDHKLGAVYFYSKALFLKGFIHCFVRQCNFAILYHESVIATKQVHSAAYAREHRFTAIGEV